MAQSVTFLLKIWKVTLFICTFAPDYDSCRGRAMR